MTLTWAHLSSTQSHTHTKSSFVLVLSDLREVLLALGAHLEVLAVLDRVVHRDEQVAHVALVRRVQGEELDLGDNSIGKLLEESLDYL